MAANPISLSFVQGDTFFLNVDWKDDLDVPMDITNATIRADIRKEYATGVVASFTVEEVDLSIGQFKLILSDTVSAALPARRGSAVTSFVFDVNVEFSNAESLTPIYGYLKMQRQVTI